MTKYTMIVNGQVARNLSQGKCLRMVRVLKQQKQQFLVLKQK